MKMSMQRDFEYPADALWAMVHDPASHVAKFERMGHTDIEVVEESVTDTSLDITIRRQVEMDIPSVAKKFFSPKNTVTSADHWVDNGDGTYGGHFDVDIKGAPAESRGVTSIEPLDDSSSRYTITVDVKIKVPLVGDRVAGAMRPQLEAQLEEEFDAAESWLSA